VKKFQIQIFLLLVTISFVPDMLCKRFMETDSYCAYSTLQQTNSQLKTNSQLSSSFIWQKEVYRPEAGQRKDITFPVSPRRLTAARQTTFGQAKHHEHLDLDGLGEEKKFKLAVSMPQSRPYDNSYPLVASPAITSLTRTGTPPPDIWISIKILSPKGKSSTFFLEKRLLQHLASQVTPEQQLLLQRWTAMDQITFTAPQQTLIPLHYKKKQQGLVTSSKLAQPEKSSIFKKQAKGPKDSFEELLITAVRKRISPTESFIQDYLDQKTTRTVLKYLFGNHLLTATSEDYIEAAITKRVNTTQRSIQQYLKLEPTYSTVIGYLFENPVGATSVDQVEATFQQRMNTTQLLIKKYLEPGPTYSTVMEYIAEKQLSDVCGIKANTSSTVFFKPLRGGDITFQFTENTTHYDFSKQINLREKRVIFAGKEVDMSNLELLADRLKSMPNESICHLIEKKKADPENK